jgi:hypothetical protein
VLKPISSMISLERVEVAKRRGARRRAVVVGSDIVENCVVGLMYLVLEGDFSVM